jgi:hypothetical protein
MQEMDFAKPWRLCMGNPISSCGIMYGLLVNITGMVLLNQETKLQYVFEFLEMSSDHAAL